MKIEIKTLWKDRKRILGMPISFTCYSISEDRLFLKKGLLSVSYEEIMLYRVRDLSLKVTLWQRLFGVGTVLVHSSDKTTPHFEIASVRNPIAVKELLHQQVEAVKVTRRVRVSELMDDEELDDDCCDEE